MWQAKPPLFGHCLSGRLRVEHDPQAAEASRCLWLLHFEARHARFLLFVAKAPKAVQHG